MKFLVFQCSEDRDYFVVTDEAHVDGLSANICPSGGELKALGEYAEMGKDRVAFDETLAKNSIEHQGYYLFEAQSFAPIPESPEMPG